MSEPSFDELLSRETLRAAAGDKYFARGEEYFEQELVDRLRVMPGVITAKVQGTEKYEVRIALADGRLEFDCTCPLADEGTVCKHCVAVGLAWIDERGASDNYTRELEDVRRHLLDLDKQALVKIVMDEAAESDGLFEKLSLAARRDAPGDFASTFRKAIDRSMRTYGFVDYYSMRGFTRGLEDVIGELSSAIATHPLECVGVLEYFLAAVEKKLHSVDDSGGYVRPIIERLEELHHAACVKAKPEPKALARRLFDRCLKADWDIFLHAAATHADVLGKEGLAEYRRLAQAEWAKVPPVGPGGKEKFSDGAFRITAIIETLAEVSGDADEMAEIIKRDLSSPYSFLRIAQVYHKAGRREEALAWAERGLKVFPKSRDGRLSEFAADEYHRLKRHDEAMALSWESYAEHPQLEAYQSLKAHADRAGQWPKWRAKAVELLQAGFEEARRKPQQPWSRPDKSALVEILLSEKDAESAWNEAKYGGCRPEHWLKLAALREKNHPEDALPVYLAEIKRLLDNAGYSPDYAGVVRLIRHVRELMNRLGRERGFAVYLNELRTVYKRKRNFMKLLERVKSVAAAS
jgi:uncharacterized Zn finger protein